MKLIGPAKFKLPVLKILSCRPRLLHKPTKNHSYCFAYRTLKTITNYKHGVVILVTKVLVGLMETDAGCLSPLEP